MHWIYIKVWLTAKPFLYLFKIGHQNFVQIPHSRFIQQLTYKAELEGIKLKGNREGATGKSP
ncbi:MAG: hypothetical protein V7K67_19265 [Nostoc sp.]